MIQDVGALVAPALQEEAPILATADVDGVERRLQAVGRQVRGQVVEQVPVRAARRFAGAPAMSCLWGPAAAGGAGPATGPTGAGGRLCPATGHL